MLQCIYIEALEHLDPPRPEAGEATVYKAERCETSHLYPTTCNQSFFSDPTHQA